MEKIDKTIKFLTKLQGTCQTQICSYNYVTDLRTALLSKENMYFCSGLKNKLGSGTNGRCKDIDIEKKCYFLIDIDIRSDYKKDFGITLDDESLHLIIKDVIEILDKDTTFFSYSYIIHTGNGLHIYYVGNENTYDIDVYKKGVQSIYKEFESKTGYKCDFATSNIGGISRLPYSINYGRNTKYGLEVREVEIIRDQEHKSSLLEQIKTRGEQEIQKEKEKIELMNQKNAERAKNFTISGNIATYEAINKIDVGTIFCSQTGCTMSEGGKVINSGRDKKPIGAFIDVDKNILVNTGTRYLNSSLGGYNTFSYVKNEVLSTEKDEDVFEYFRNEYPQIKEIDNDHRRIHMQEEEKKKTQKQIDLAKQAPKAQPTIKEGGPKNFSEMGLLKFSTGISKIDEVVGHMWSHELVLLHGASKNGKTMLTMSIANENGASGIKTAFLSLEMEIEKLKTQQSCIRSGIDRSTFENGTYSEKQREKYCDVYNNFDKYFTIFDESSFTESLSSEYICSQIEKLHKEDGYELFIIDSLQLMLGDNSADQNRLQAKCIKDFKTLKNKLGICIVLIHHNNKGGDTFSGAQELENFSDWRISIRKELDPDANGVSIFHKSVVTIGKERMGKELEFEFNFDKGNLVYLTHGYPGATK